VRVTLPLRLPQSLGQQPLAQGLRRDDQGALGQLLAGEGGAEVGLVAAVDLEDLASLGGIDAVVGGLAAQAMDDGLIPFALKAAADATDLSRAQPQQSCEGLVQRKCLLAVEAPALERLRRSTL